MVTPLGRRIKKVISNSGDLDGTEYFVIGAGGAGIKVRDSSSGRATYLGPKTKVEVLELPPDAQVKVDDDGNVELPQDPPEGSDAGPEGAAGPPAAEAPVDETPGDSDTPDDETGGAPEVRNVTTTAE